MQGAIKARQPSVELMGRSIEVNCNAGIFVTMNPAGKGYGGRSKLPDNLKALFRSVAMTLPDNEIIAEVLLLSNGFASAKELGRWVGHFPVCKHLAEQLSSTSPSVAANQSISLVAWQCSQRVAVIEYLPAQLLLWMRLELISRTQLISK